MKPLKALRQLVTGNIDAALNLPRDMK